MFFYFSLLDWNMKYKSKNTAEKRNVRKTYVYIYMLHIYLYKNIYLDKYKVWHLVLLNSYHQDATQTDVIISG